MRNNVGQTKGESVEAILAAGLGMLMAEATKQLTSKATTKLVDGVVGAIANRFGRTPQATDGTVEALTEAAADPAIVPEVVEEYVGQSSALRRLRRVLDLTDGARVLWIDDHPQWNSWEIACLEAVGMTVRTVESTQSALALVAQDFDLVISDIARGEDARAGLDALPALRESAPAVPVVFYVGWAEGCVPEGAFGITATPDELMHLVLDVIERERV